MQKKVVPSFLLRITTIFLTIFVSFFAFADTGTEADQFEQVLKNNDHIVDQEGNVYEIQRKLGEGGYAVVYEVKDQVGNIFAFRLKMDGVKPQVRNFRSPFLAQIQQKEVYFGKEKKVIEVMPVYFMTLKELIDVSSDIKTPDDQKIKTAHKLLLDMIRAIGHLTSFGYVHNDIKPHNIFYDNEGFILGDFDLLTEQRKNEVSQGSSKKFESPELFMQLPTTPHSDYYSLSLTLVNVLLGRKFDTLFKYQIVDINGKKSKDKMLKIQINKLVDELSKIEKTLNQQRRLKFKILKRIIFSSLIDEPSERAKEVDAFLTNRPPSCRALFW